MNVINRHIYKAIREYQSKYPILALTGPRQSGKTTLSKTLFPDYRYVSLENPDARDFAQKDPNGFLAEYNDQMIFDEVQQAPALFSYLQTLVDSRPDRMGGFILSGSQNFHLMERITQSLAGRVALFKLFPLDIQELKDANLLAQDPFEQLLHGFYPALYDRKISPGVFYSNYVQTYVNRDVTELMTVKDLRQFQNFLNLCAARAGQLLNLSALANEAGISQPTAKSWLSALESSYITFQLYPYHKNFSKRVVKTPKLYFYDTGLLAFLLKIKNRETLLTHPVKGALFENMVVAEFHKQMHHTYQNQSPWFWRDNHGDEVDLLLDQGLTLDVFEIKASETILTENFKGLAKFEQISDIQLTAKGLIYAGDLNQKRSHGQVISWRDFPKF
ncbi:ATP-binding protein [Algoriphagus sp. A40]|uniref:ATP-binding protein n=1 Tax=Algoriphagus sp. A40 TaxID=1945863 RepID=UPI000984A206|nr:ATP-binding protein [Algoriphagus sp. A40]OOG78551.1 AAA family ATPase [Algoriphagus sp. A40]